VNSQILKCILDIPFTLPATSDDLDIA